MPAASQVTGLPSGFIAKDVDGCSRLCLQLYVSHSLSLAAWSLILQSFAAGRAVLAPGCMMEPSPLALLDGLAVKGCSWLCWHSPASPPICWNLKVLQA